MKVFISYKTEDVNIVRNLAERLICCGVDVWINEYSILLEQYDNFPTHLFEGIESATHALFFTNDKWAKSEHCQIEMIGLCERAELDRRNMLEIQIPKEEMPRKCFPEFKDIKAIVFNNDIDMLVGEICDQFRIEKKLLCAGDTFTKKKQSLYARSGLSIDTGGLSLKIEKSKALSRISLRFLQSVIFEGRIIGWDVQLRLEIYPFDSVLDNLSISQEEELDDRKVYKKYRQYAKKWKDEQFEQAKLQKKQLRINGPELQLEIKGLHLFFLENETTTQIRKNRSHFGLTYTSGQYGDDEVMWERRYVISLRGEDRFVKEKGEVTLLFSVKLKGGEQEQKEIFSRLCPYFEGIASTIRYHTPDFRLTSLNNIPIFANKLLSIIAAVFLTAYFLRHKLSPAAFFSTLTLLGFLFVDILVFVNSRLYQRCTWLLQPLIDDVIPLKPYERLSNNFVFWITGNPIALLGNAFFGLIGIFASKKTLLKVPTAILLVAMIFLVLLVAGNPQLLQQGNTSITIGLASLIFGGLLSALGISSFVDRHIHINQI